MLLGSEEELYFLCKPLTFVRGHFAPVPALAYILLFLEQKVAVIRIGEVVLKEMEPSDKFDTTGWL